MEVLLFVFYIVFHSTFVCTHMCADMLNCLVWSSGHFTMFGSKAYQFSIKKLLLGYDLHFAYYPLSMMLCIFLGLGFQNKGDEDLELKKITLEVIFLQKGSCLDLLNIKEIIYLHFFKSLSYQCFFFIIFRPAICLP